MNKESTLGRHELDLLTFVAENGPISVGDVSKIYGAPRGLARTTILTVMERLRKKGFLTRRQVNAVYQYSPKIEHADLLTNLVAEFVQRSLGGSLSPFVAYLADSGKLSEKEIDELKRMVESLESADTEAK